ncbi:MAG: hypothetical protein KQI78_20095 [Deltaproteobacteria bacterium]|jgi:hypothetical protein|nr:hypothetical protein [Deltaproteobacteria bacterium]
MVDSIRQAGRIGVVMPTGLSRPVERRRHPRKDPHDDQNSESRPTEEEEQLEAFDGEPLPADDSESTMSPDQQHQGQTGRRINVRI